VGDTEPETKLGIDAILSVGDTVPDCVRGCSDGALDCALAEGFTFGGRIICFFGCKPAGGRIEPVMGKVGLRQILDWEGARRTFQRLLGVEFVNKL
jgi:hypothetical protein